MEILLILVTMRCKNMLKSLRMVIQPSSSKM
jgi:hypothetical protein